MLKITGTHIIHESPVSHEAVVAAVTHNILSVHPQEKKNIYIEPSKNKPHNKDANKEKKSMLISLNNSAIVYMQITNYKMN